MKHIIIALALCLVGCGPYQAYDNSTKPEDTRMAEAMCANLGGLKRYWVRRTTEDGRLKEIRRWVDCNDDSRVERVEKQP